MATAVSKASKEDVEARVKQLEAEIEIRQDEYNNLSMEMALQISEFFEVMQRLTQGDFEVRASEESPNDLFANFGKVINQTIEALGNETRQLEEANRRQLVALREMATPIIQVWDKVLCLPIVGVVDTKRSAEMMETLLNHVVETKCRCVIVDVTGVDVVDTQTADHFINMVRAANLLGAHCMITGVSPQIAQTLTQIGVDLSGIKTLSNLQAGLDESFKTMSLKVIHREES
jgi:anti-anti-sigma regulatory factor